MGKMIYGNATVARRPGPRTAGLSAPGPEGPPRRDSLLLAMLGELEALGFEVRTLAQEIDAAG